MGFLESAFGEPALIEGEAADQVLAQGAGGPLAKPSPRSDLTR